jgi:VWFA-related protein
MMIFRIQTILIVLLACLPPSAAQTPPAPAPAQEPAQQGTPVFRTGVSDIRVVVEVTENNDIVKGLTKNDFIVEDQDKPQPIASCDQEKEQLDLLLLLDISGSMRPHIQEMSEKARDALKFLLPGDRVAIMTFGLRTNLHFGWFDNHAEVARQLHTAIDDQEKVGYGTAINAAIIEASRYLDKDDSGARRAILIVTDNLGLNYQANDSLAIGYLLKSDAVLNAIVIGRGIRPGPPRAGDDPDFTPADVFKLAEATGGDAVRADHAAAFFPEMVSRIRDRYTIAYHLPEGAQPGQFRHIAVHLAPATRQAHPNAIVRARTGYYVRQ